MIEKDYLHYATIHSFNTFRYVIEKIAMATVF